MCGRGRCRVEGKVDEVTELRKNSHTGSGQRVHCSLPSGCQITDIYRTW